ncbi:hypothetical protein PtA15_3A376 [Puccinia triticina]|uniref:Zn(2)-C6 fungal-type domain-containing protein n=1 Tax=Puccinia triticina TaxID=208348 RepID=A0ABY7CE18_9BASI|nr:uncharacterized protein PtA15_3A376 [Puccinia triticina]WAQ83010.1 hypothetical protein PtA15_3A376 [Puccinia triticina]
MLNGKTSTSMQAQPPPGQQQQQSTKRRRYRIPRSCDRCRTSKIKCVFEDGRCTACVNLGVPCTFENPGSLRERPPTRKDVEHLQARIRSLERLIHAIDPSCDLSNLPDPPQSYPSNLRLGRQRPSPSSVNLPGDIHPSPNSTHLNPSAPTIPAQVTPSVSTLDSLFNPTRLQNHNPTKNLLPSQSKLEDLSPVDKIIRHEQQKLSYSSPDFYPPPDLQQSLLEIYFQQVHPLMRAVHPASFIKDFKAGRVEADDGFKALCLIIFGLASRFSKDPRVYLNIEGNPNAYLQTAGLHYCLSASFYLFRPIPSPATLNELQALPLTIMYALGAVNAHLVWCLLGAALQRAQDNYRRKIFFVLYELDSVVSGTLGKPAYMQESDFDVLPGDPDFDRELEVCVNPFLNPSCTEDPSDHIVDEIFRAYNVMQSSLGGLKNFLPVINLINAQRDMQPGVKFLSCVKALIKQLDNSMNTCFQKVTLKINARHPNSNLISDSALLSSVVVTSWYHEFRLLLHQVLVNSREKSQRAEPNKPEEKQQAGIPEPSTTTKKSSHPYLDICVESARAIISLLNQLHQRNLLALGFFWIPLRLKNALLILVCSLVKQRRSLSEEERRARCLEISLGIQTLNTLAPSTYLAAKVSNTVINLYKSAIQHNQQHAVKADSTSTLSASPSSSTPPAPSGPDSNSHSFLGPSAETASANKNQPGESSMFASSPPTVTSTSTAFSFTDQPTPDLDPESTWWADQALFNPNGPFPNLVPDQVPSASCCDANDPNFSHFNFWPSSSVPDLPPHSSA